MAPENKTFVQPEDTGTMDTVLESQDTTNIDSEPETTPEPDVPSAPAYKLGVVADCVKLNVRECASTIAKVVRTIPKGTKVAAFEEEGCDEFYRIETVSGVKGYCMKKYIDVNR